MKYQKKTILQFVLEPEDAKIIRQALIYVRHRINQHPNCGARTIPLEEVDRLLNEFDGN